MPRRSRRSSQSGSKIRCRSTTPIRGSACAKVRRFPSAWENLARREGFKDFIFNQGADILHPDLRISGGFLETKRIADLAHIFGLALACHNTDSQVNTYATCQCAASIRDYISCETVSGEGGWMDQVLVLDGPYIEDGFIEVSGKPGLGVALDPEVVNADLAAGEVWWG